MWLKELLAFLKNTTVSIKPDMGIERNQARLTITHIAHNLQRVVNIQRSCA
jgi:hypothetical protein